MSKYFGALLNAVIAIVALAGAAVITGISSISELLPMLVTLGVVFGLALYFSTWYTKKKAEMYR